MNSVHMTIVFWLGAYLVKTYNGVPVAVGGLNGGEGWKDHDEE